eukprot:3979786-Prymnesium_polylepis.1
MRFFSFLRWRRSDCAGGLSRQSRACACGRDPAAAAQLPVRERTGACAQPPAPSGACRFPAGPPGSS